MNQTKKVTSTKNQVGNRANDYFMFLNESLKQKPLYKVKEEMNQIGGWSKKLQQIKQAGAGGGPKKRGS